MELKKNPKKDLNRNSGTYFAIGMFAVLMLTYVALEWKSFYKYEFIPEGIASEELTEELPPLTFVTPPPPPPPPAAPTIIEIVPDDPEIIETIMKSTESNEEKEVAKVSEVDYEEVEPEVDIPFSVIENVPVFPGCENDSNKRACFNKMILKHVRKTFRYPEIAQEMGIQGKVHMQFVIQKDGTIGNVQIARSPDKNLGTEAIRIIDKLPQMTPGKQRGKAVRVPFSLPITFKLQ